MGIRKFIVSKFRKIMHKHKRKRKSHAILCSDEGNLNYFECLSVQNGVLGHHETSMFSTSVCKHVRGEIVLEQNLNSDDNKGRDYHHAHAKIQSSIRRILQCNQKESVHNTLRKSSYKCRLKPQMPRKYVSNDDFIVGKRQESDWSIHVGEKCNESIYSEMEGRSVECEDRSTSCYLEVSDNDSGIDSLQDSLDIDKRRFVEYCNAKYWYTTGSMGLGSHESLNRAVTDGAYNDPGIVPKDGIYSRADNTMPNGIVINAWRYTSSHRCSYPSHSAGSVEDGFVSEENKGDLSCSVEFTAQYQNSEPRDARLAFVHEIPNKDRRICIDTVPNKDRRICIDTVPNKDRRICIDTVPNKDRRICIDTVPNKDKTGPEPFVESSDSEWNTEEGYVSSETSESLSCIESINISPDNDSCLDVHVITAGNSKKDDDDDNDDNSQDEYVKKCQRSLARNSKDETSTQVESTENTTSHQKFNKSDEEQEPSIYNHLNENQSDNVMLHLNLCNSKLGIVQMHVRNMPFNLETISQAESSLFPRESNLTRSSCFFSEKGIKIAIREVSMKQSRTSDKPRRFYPSGVQSQLVSIPISELGIAERDTNFKLGALAKWSSEDENPFKQGSSLRWIFQYGSVMQESIMRLQHWLRHQLYPFTNIKDFWVSLGTDSPPSLEECMSVEWMRYQTFQNFPISAHGSPSRLAREGFYYTGQGTQARCFSCGITHSDWNRVDNPHEVHHRLSPNCPFLNGRQERYPNIPMSPDGSVNVGRADRDSIPPPSLPIAPLPGSGTGQSQTEERRSESREGSEATKTTDEDDTVRQQQNLRSGETTPRVPSNPVEESAQSEADNKPKFPEHVSLPSRIATFSHGWPPYLDQTPQQMAEAGFFFTGNQDYTRCYQCGGGLRNWEPGDNPWIEHCRWYPTCPHVEKGKGQRFVNAVLKKQAELLANQRADSRKKAQYGSGSTDPMETLAAITLLEMGYPRDTVRNSILILRRQKEPSAEITAQEVLDFIWKEEDIERQRQEEEASRPRRPGDAQPPALPNLMERLNLGSSPAVTQAAVQQSASIITTTSSLTTAAMTVTSVTMAISSTSGTSGTTSMLTSTSGPTQNSSASGQEQRQDEGRGCNTNVGGNGNKRGGSIQKDGVSEGSVDTDSHAQNHEESEQEQQRPNGAVGGQSEEPGANAHAIAEAIEDEEFHSLDSEEMENKDPGELEEENKRLKEQTTCKICMENPVRVIFIPCGHLVCCETCAPAFRKCPICRKRIQQSIKTFL